MSQWSQKVTWDEVCKRASGRRAYNQQRRHVMKARRHQVGTLLAQYGPWDRGTQARIARELGVSRATISRDVDAILHMQSKRPFVSADAIGLRKAIAQRLAEMDKLNAKEWSAAV